MNAKVLDLAQRLKSTENKLESVNNTMETKLTLLNKDTSKQFKYLMEAQDSITSQINDGLNKAHGSIQSNTDTMKII